MAHAIEVQYEFQDLRLAGEGILGNGTAILVDAGPEYEGEWYVSEVRLDKGPTLRRHHTCNTFHAMLFEHIAGIIEADRDADTAFQDADEYPATKIYSSLQHSTMDARTQGLRHG